MYHPPEYDAHEEATRTREREAIRWLLKNDEIFGEMMANEGVGCKYCQEKIKDYFYE